MSNMKSGERFFLILLLLLYVSAIGALGVATRSSLSSIFIGTLPLLLFLLSFFFLFTRHKVNKVILWLLPLLFPLLFFGFWQANVLHTLSSMEGPALTVMNILLNYVITIFFLIIFTNRFQNRFHVEEIHHLRKKVKEYEEKLNITDKNMKFNLRSIEDKCKALNFVVGRVYSDKKGGNKSLREQLKIHRDWYNLFTEITADPQKEDLHALHEVLEKIMGTLTLMEKKESSVLKVKKGKLPVERMDSDTVLQVLVRNDKDPVADYHAQAKEICEKIINFLEKED
jgi:hypothetical protein